MFWARFQKTTSQKPSKKQNFPPAVTLLFRPLPHITDLWAAWPAAKCQAAFRTATSRFLKTRNRQLKKSWKPRPAAENRPKSSANSAANLISAPFTNFVSSIWRMMTANWNKWERIVPAEIFYAGNARKTRPAKWKPFWRIFSKKEKKRMIYCRFLGLIIRGNKKSYLQNIDDKPQ